MVSWDGDGLPALYPPRAKVRRGTAVPVVPGGAVHVDELQVEKAAGTQRGSKQAHDWRVSKPVGRQRLQRRASLDAQELLASRCRTGSGGSRARSETS